MLLIWLALSFTQKGRAQQPDSSAIRSNWQVKTIPVLDSLIIDSFSIAPKSFHIKNIPDSNFICLPEQALLVWKYKPCQDSVRISYRRLAIAIAARHQHHQLSAVNTNIAFPMQTISEQNEMTDKNFVNFNSIDYNGTYGRSLTLGNQQDVSLNSNFDLQLNGYILDSIRIEAALSDNNIPFQPDGNTQQIQEFDKIYITFEKGRHKLTAGDYELAPPNSHFMNFNKRVQGVFYQGSVPDNKKIQNKVGLSASIAKGEFARNVFQGEEGNQGPYKLQGNNGEQFFIVLAGSEKVYIDGILMQRGEDRDYTIDYNTSEITFMPGRMITKDSRIQVEFEYQNRSYLNTLLYAYDELTINKKWQFKFHAYSNQDSRNQAYLQDLSGAQKRFLSGIGDNIDEAFYPSIQQDTFAAGKVLYRMTDSLVNGILYDSVFVYSTQKDSTLYALGFSYVGDHKGNYLISGDNANGRSYRWIAPLSGQPQGSYAPYVLLVTPKKQQMFTVGGSYQIDSLKQAGFEMAASNYAPNLFSRADNQLHWGFAGNAFYNEKRNFGKTDSAGRQHWQWANSISYEWTQSQFTPIAPYRDVEFDRDWNISAYDSSNNNRQNNGDETLINFKTAISRQSWGSLSYQLSRYKEGNIFKANQHNITLNLAHKTYKAGIIYNLMHAGNPLQESDYLRPSAFFEKQFPRFAGISIGATWEQERNNIRNIPGGLLSAAAFAYNQLSVYLRNGGDQKTRFSLEYQYREDQKPDQESFIPESHAQTVKADLTIGSWKGQQIILTAAYRILSTQDSSLINTPNGGQNILARLQYQGNIGKGFIIPATLFEIGSGQQQKQEYIYVKVPTGQGIYTWVDYNHDSVQQANEFEVAVYPDQKQYIRIISPINTYVSVNYTTLTQALSVSPDNLWAGKSKKDWQKFAGRFSDQLSLQINNRGLADAGLRGFNPFSHSIADENIIANATSLNNSVYFNQLSSVWGLTYNYLYQSGKSLLTYGLEGNDRSMHNLSARVVLFKSLTVDATLGNGYRGYHSAVSDDGRTYNFSDRLIHPELSWILGSRLRIKAGYQWNERQNRKDLGDELADIQSVDLSFRLSFPKTGNINLSGKYAAIRFTGEDNTSLAFAILDALQKGSNWLWQLSWERNIGRGIQISLEYDGRKSQGSEIIHTGTMSIRAIL
ncbi:MAG TPA: hypothetical protein VFL76_02775 [Edaphocola sp.]|nr:hypothetical protein [Edaphocola sp.]